MEIKHWREKKQKNKKKQRKRPIYISQKEKYKLKHKNNPKKRRIWLKEKQTKETETKHTKKEKIPCCHQEIHLLIPPHLVQEIGQLVVTYIHNAIQANEKIMELFSCMIKGATCMAK
jgi:predicted metalloprotease